MGGKKGMPRVSMTGKRITQEKRDLAARAYLAGVPSKDIANLLGVTYGTVTKWAAAVSGKNRR